MPTVPSYGGAPRVQESAGPSNLGQITARPDAEALNAGESMNRMTSAASQLYDKVRNDADQVAVLDADARLAEYQTKALYDPTTGALNKKGKDAFGSVETVNEDLDKQLSEIESGLTSSAQKAAFRQKALQAKDQINRSLNQHVAGEISRYDSEKTQAYVTSQQNLVTANPYDPQAVQLAKESQAAALYQYAERMGQPPEWARLKIEQAESQTNMAALQKMMADGNDIAAEEYFKTHAETFQGQDRLQATRMVEEGSTLGKAMRMADDSLQRGLSLSGMMAEARTIENPKLRRAFEDRARDLDQQRKMAKADFEEKVNIRAANFIDQGGNWQDYAKQNATQWAQLTEQKRENIMSYRRGGAKVTDQKVWYALKELAGNPATHDDFMRTDLTKYLNDLSAGDFQEVAKWQDEAKKGDKRALRGIQKETDIVNAALNEMGFSKEQRRPDTDNQSVRDFRYAVEDWKQDFSEQHKRAPSINELTDAAKKLSYEVVTQKNAFWFDQKKRVYELSDEDVSKIKVSDIPPAKRNEIREALKRAGKSITPENERELWVKKLTAGRKVSAN